MGGFSLGLAAILLASIGATPGRSTIAFGQISVVIVALVAADLFLVTDRAAGVGIGIAAAIKLTPLLFIPYLWLAGRRRAAATAAFTATAAAWVLDPSDSRRYWLNEAFDPSRSVHVDITANQSMRAALNRTSIPLLASETAWLSATVVIAIVSLVTAAALSRRG